ncbi:Detected protein of unknown function [Hibiscus syriacus]|uniref:VTT domain-containing protein n=1 Tax=Hibiscus syriacus TaxID=106335 RepID=A0A6A2XV97_HIBSY|nr:Detected protein of unknown function [Hibiscus syriacus]
MIKANNTRVLDLYNMANRVFACIPLTVLPVPAAVLTLGGGYLLGLPLGFITYSIGSTLGATVAFIFGRTIGRPYVISKLRNYSQFQAVAIANSFSAPTCSSIAIQHVELPPFGDFRPFGGVRFGILVGNDVVNRRVASYLLQPITFGMVYVGTTLKDLSDVTHGIDEVSTSHQVIMASAILIFCITKVDKSALEKALAESAKQGIILAPSMLPIVADNSSVDLHKPFVIGDENERQSLV